MTNSDRSNDRWGDDAGQAGGSRLESDGSWLLWALLVLLLLALVGGGVAFYQMRQARTMALMEAMRAEQERQAVLSHRAAEVQRLATRTTEEAMHALEATNIADLPPGSIPDLWKSKWPNMKLADRNRQVWHVILSNQRRETGIPRLIESLSHHDPGIRTDAARWLGVIGWPARDAIAELKKLQSDMDAEVQKAAADAIERIEKDKPSDGTGTND